MIRARLRAALREAGRALAGASPLAVWLATAEAFPRGDILAIWGAAAALFAPVTLALFERLLPPASGVLAREGLRLEGAGCLLCRDMRRAWPLAAFPLAWLTGHPAAAALGGALFAWHVGTYLMALRGGRPAPWDAATGLFVAKA